MATSGIELKDTIRGSIEKAFQDESGNNIKSSYASSISIDNHTITLKNKNGESLGTVTVPDNNTTYSAGDHLKLSGTTFKLNETCKQITDWNNATTNGFYMGYDIPNQPVENNGWYYGEVIAHNANYVRQIVYKFAGDNNVTGNNVNKYERIKHNGTWGTWAETTVRTAVPANAKFTDTIYTLPVATSSALGGVKSGTDITVDSNGNVSVNNDSHTHDGRYYTETEMNTKLSGKLDTSLKGAVNGLAELDSNGKVPSSQLPSYVDDVIEGYLSDGKFYKEEAHTTLIVGETGKIYVNLSDDKTYRWSGSSYVVISETIALGETSSTAYRGDRGKTAYDHSQSTHARTDATKVEASTTNGKIKINGTETTVYTHPTSSGNKHIPSGGSSGQILKWSSDGTATWANNTGVQNSLSSTSTTDALSAAQGKVLNDNKLDKSGGTITGALNFTGDNSRTITWNDDTYRQRIQVVDDSTADTAVFEFKQSSDCGQNYGTLMTIKDNGSVVANKFVGTLEGDASSVNGKTVATSVPANAVFTDNKVTQTNNNSSNADFRLLLSANSNDTTETNGAVKSTKFKANPATGNLTANSVTVDNVVFNRPTTAGDKKGFTFQGVTDSASIFYTEPTLKDDGRMVFQIKDNDTDPIVFSWNLHRSDGNIDKDVHVFDANGYTINGNISPKTNNTFNIGTSTNKFSNVYASTFNGSLSGNATSATSATKATQDESGNNIKASYASGLSISGNTLTLSNKNGTTLSSVNVPNNDTKNTAGSTDSNSKLFLIGATSQAANPQTYSHDTAYVGSDGCLYSNNTKVSVDGHTHSYLPLTGGTVTGATQFNNYLKLNAWSGYGTGQASFWYDGNNRFVEIQNATDLRLGGVKVSKDGHNHNSSYVNVGGDTMTGALSITNTTASTNTNTGALKVTGGVGVSGRMSAKEVMIGNGCTLKYIDDAVSFVFN